MKSPKKNSRALKVVRKGLGFNPDDVKVLARIKRELGSTHGALSDMAVVRMGLLRVYTDILEVGK